ncbi:MAG TPA: DUF4290 domain-containing protein [Sphingobacterium sp.]|nr:DUF4290 domain-containing protein [Sphingobacterium sp.]
MSFDYNSTRPNLILAEYGRNVQNMVDYICTLPTKEERNKYAQVVIDMMGNLNPHLRDVSDFKHKLWDHLFIISDFKLDVDSPYPVPQKGETVNSPETLQYPQNPIKKKHYGYTVEKMIEKAVSREDSEEKERMVLAIANFMKMAYHSWHNNTVSDEQIIEDLITLSKDKLTLPKDTELAPLEFKSTPPGGNRGKHNNPSNTANKGKKQNKKKKKRIKR